jgi:hypothetical protein
MGLAVRASAIVTEGIRAWGFWSLEKPKLRGPHSPTDYRMREKSVRINMLRGSPSLAGEPGWAPMRRSPIVFAAI